MNSASDPSWSGRAAPQVTTLSRLSLPPDRHPYSAAPTRPAVASIRCDIGSAMYGSLYKVRATIAIAARGTISLMNTTPRRQPSSAFRRT